MSVQENLDRIRVQIEEAAGKFGHKPEDISLVGVTKFVDEDRIREAVKAGLVQVGENRVQEIIRKKDMFQGCKIHMIGQLQTNKVRKLPAGIELVQSIDRISLLKELERIGQKENKEFNGLIQVNLAREEQKGGCYEEDLPDLLDYAESLDHVRISGLMMVAPDCEDIEDTRPYFRSCRKLYEKLCGMSYNRIEMKILSIGMSHDFRVALEEGSNMVRIGRAIFGERDYSKGN